MKIEDARKLSLTETCLLAMAPNAAREIGVVHFVLFISKINFVFDTLHSRIQNHCAYKKVCKVAPRATFLIGTHGGNGPARSTNNAIAVCRKVACGAICDTLEAHNHPLGLLR